MDLSEIERRVCDVAARELGIPRARVTSGSRLLADLHCDSLDFVELLMELEEEFAVKLPDSPPDPIYKSVFTRAELTLGDLAEAIYLRQGVVGRDATAGANAQETAGKTSTSGQLVTFTQLGGRWQPWLAQQALALHEELELEDESAVRVTTETGRQQAGTLPRYRRRSDGMRCVRIPGAVVEIGSEAAEAEPDEQPVHLVSLDAFLLDAEPVSVTAYGRFLNSITPSREDLESWILLAPEDDRGVHLPLRQSEDGSWVPVPGTEYLPMVMVSWFGANAYARWAHGVDWRDYRGEAPYLPSEAQWEYAARGSMHAVLDECDDNRDITVPSAVHGRHVRGERYKDGLLPLSPVNARLGLSPWGMHHMSGNIWHWCRDWYDAGFYQRAESVGRNPLGARDTGVRSERGGSWVGPAHLTRVSHRRGREPGARGRCLGFRCCGPVADVTR